MRHGESMIESIAIESTGLGLGYGIRVYQLIDRRRLGETEKIIFWFGLVWFGFVFSVSQEEREERERE